MRAFGQLDQAAFERLGVVALRLQRKRPLRVAVNVGTVADSMTLTHGLNAMDPKYSAAALASAGVRFRAIAAISKALALLMSALLRRPLAKSAICRRNVVHRQAGNRGALHQPLTVGVMANRACPEPARLLAMRHDVGHRRVVAGKPIGRSVGRCDLRNGERSVTACETHERARGVGGHPTRPVAVSRSAARTPCRPVLWCCRRRDVAVRPQRKIGGVHQKPGALRKQLRAARRDAHTEDSAGCPRDLPCRPSIDYCGS